jgi:parallel beta helix pectate lyase-like protein
MDLRGFDNKVLKVGVGACTAVTAAVFCLMGLIAVPAAQAGVVSCAPIIVGCGCTITDSGTHVLGNNISDADGLTAKGDCIDIKHADATLDADFFDADGSGSGVGVRILPGAKRVTVQNFDFLDGWDIGLEDDAASANINNNDIGSNGTAGVLLKSVSKTVVTDFDADDALGSCIIVKNSNQNTIQDFDASDCGGDGITVIHSSGNTFSDFSADDTGGDGVDFQNSSKTALTFFESDSNLGDGVAFTKNSNKNSVSGYDASSNGGDGIFIDPSSNDKVADGSADSNSSNGVEIAKGSKSDSVLFNEAILNGGIDLLDNNASCFNGKNVWENNCFDTSSPPECIVEGLGC